MVLSLILCSMIHGQINEQIVASYIRETSLVSPSLKASMLATFLHKGMSRNEVEVILGHPEVVTSIGPLDSPFLSYEYCSLSLLVNFDRRGLLESFSIAKK